MKIVLGCGDDRLPGWIHHDRHRHSPHVDVGWDLTWRPWPWNDDFAEEIRAWHVLEHLVDTVGFMDEAWRVLRAGGVLTLAVPHCDGFNAWVDPTHVRAFRPETFRYFDPDCLEWHQYGRLYTERAWRVVLLHSDATEIIARLEKRGQGA